MLELRWKPPKGGDPRFDVLVERLMQRMSMDKQTVLEKMVQLAQGNIHV